MNDSPLLGNQIDTLIKRLNNFEIELENKDNSYNHDREIITGTLKEAQSEIQSLIYANNTLTQEVSQLTYEVSELTRKFNDIENRLYSLER